MSRLTLTPTRMLEGIWQGSLVQDGGTEEPRIRVTHLGKGVPDVQIRSTSENEWQVQIPIPPEAITDGVQTILIENAHDDTRLSQITFIAGEAMGEDIRAEVELLRAELDMLKRAFRRHCAETT